MQFKQGDQAVCTLDDQKVEVQFGPVLNSVGNESYLVKWLDTEQSSLVWVEDLKPAPRFKVGQKVTFSYSAKGDSFELVSGPHSTFDKDTFWVIKDERGDCSTSGEKFMIPGV